MKSTETPGLPAVRNPSIWRLALQGYLALIAAVVLGVVGAAPLINSQMRYFAESDFVLGARPANDAQLKVWALAQPGLVSFVTERQADNLRIRAEYRGGASQKPSATQLIAEMHRLGYELRGMKGVAMGMASDYREIFTNPLALAAMLAAMQVAFGLIGWNRIRAAVGDRRTFAYLFAGNAGRAIAFGALGGLGLLALGCVNQYGLTILFGHAPPSPWDASAAMPPQAKLAFLLFGGLGAPIAEEIFFRGYLFGKFRRADCAGFGMLFSSFLFAVVHFSDPYNLPGIFLFGVCLSWLYQRTGSLLAPILAHGVNNGIVILWMIWS